MILIGRFLSPFVRRVAASLHYQGFTFQHQALRAAGEEQDEIRKSNPLGRVPALVLDNGKVLADSAVILEYLDEMAVFEKTLVPRTGWTRFEFNSLLSIANGACEKAIFSYMEVRNRPESKVHQPAIDAAGKQSRDGFEYLCRFSSGEWLFGDVMTQLDISTACYWSFVTQETPEISDGADCARLDQLVSRLSGLEWFNKTAP